MKVYRNQVQHKIISHIPLSVWVYDQKYQEQKSRGVMVKVLDCGFEVSEFQHQSRYYV